jgi:hypothetical protein
LSVCCLSPSIISWLDRTCSFDGRVMHSSDAENNNNDNSTLCVMRYHYITRDTAQW